MMIVPNSLPPEKINDLLVRGSVVEREALEYLAKDFEPAREALDVVKKHEHEGLTALVVMDPDEEALVVLWRTGDADDISSVP